MANKQTEIKEVIRKTAEQLRSETLERRKANAEKQGYKMEIRGVSMTQPGQSMTVQEMMVQYANGNIAQLGGYVREPNTYDSQLGLTDEQMHNLSATSDIYDITQVNNSLKVANEAKARFLAKQKEEHKKAKEQPAEPVVTPEPVKGEI